ncbi:hypothetical protein D3C85_1640170 [compost metagenome]
MAGMAGFEHAVLHFHHVVARRIVVGQRHAVGALPGEAARGWVGFVLQLGHRLHDALAHFLAHVGLVVEHARDSLHRHAGGGGDILDSNTH